MPKITANVKLPDFTYDTPCKTDVSIGDTVKKCKRTALVFLRYYGCTLCQLDLHEFKEKHELIAKTGGQMLVVLQSDREKLAKELEKNPLPFEIICDPEMKLYKMFDIEKAPSMLKMVDFHTVGKMVRATAKGMKHGEYEGEELQKPALLVVDENMNVTFAHYGKAAGDVPKIEKIAELLK